MPQATLTVTATAKIDQELNKLKKIRVAAQQKAKETLNQITKVQKEKVVTSKEINTLLVQLDDASQKLSKLNEEIDKVSEELVQNALELELAMQRVENRDQLLKSRIRLIYMNGIVSYLDVLLSSTSFSDFLNRLDALKSIVDQDKDILDTNRKDRDIVSFKKNQTEEQLSEVKTLYEQANQLRAELVVKEKEKELRIASLSQQERTLEGITEENERKLMQYAAQEAALIKKKKEAEDALYYTYKGGKFGFPLSVKARLTSTFGKRVDPITGKKGATHNGIDLGAPNGTNILAAENGVVIVASWWGGYGNTVVIDHGQNTWTLYAHIRNEGIVVKKGQSVKRGQKIAEVGSTGRSTGNHLHLEVRINEKPVDPAPYLR